MLQEPIQPIVVLVCGGRDFANLSDKKWGSEEWTTAVKQHQFISKSLSEFAIRHSKFYVPNDNWLPFDICIIAGKATGADSAAVDWASVNWCSFKEYPADWKTHGKAAGYIRNKQMLEEGKPNFVLAFPGGKGTANMVKLAEDAGVPVIKYTYDDFIPC